MKQRAVLLIFTLCLAGCMAQPPEAAQQAAASQSEQVKPDFSVAGLTSGEVQVFLSALQQAVAGGDRGGVAALVSYPLTVRVAGRSIIIKSPAELVASYDRIVTPGIAKAVRRAEYSKLFVNYQGVRIGSGEVWFAGVYERVRGATDRYEVKVVAFNVP